MKEQQLDELIRDVYVEKELSASKLEHILRRTPEVEKVVPFYRREWFSYAAAACVALMIVSVVLTNLKSNVDRVGQTQLASGVVSIYDKHYEPEVQSSDLRSIAVGLNHSDFSIIPSDMKPLSHYEVIGGRSCGLGGYKAVHVVLHNPATQKEVCLYVLPDTNAFEEISNSRMNYQGKEISFWHDSGRMFVLYDPS